MSFTYAYRLDDEDTPKRDPNGHKKRPFHAYEQTFTAQHVHFYISDEIEAPEDYADMIHRINVATPSDVIFIHLNTPGGRLDTGIQIINAMQNSQAKIVTVLESMAFSLGTLIFLAGDEMVVNDHCMMMFHNFRGGVVGKGQELAAQLEATIKWFSALARKLYIPFLTESEFDRIIKGEDIWMHSAEIRRRLEKMVKVASSPKKATRKKKEKVKKVKVNQEPS